MFYLIIPGLRSQTAPPPAVLNGLNFSKFCFWFQSNKAPLEFVQRIHKKSETEFETIEFIRRDGEQGCIQALLPSRTERCSQKWNVESFKSWLKPSQRLSRFQTEKEDSVSFYQETFRLPSHPPWPDCSSQGWRRCTCWWRWGSWWPGRWEGRRWPRWCCHSFLDIPSPDQLEDKYNFLWLEMEEICFNSSP